MGLFGYSFVDLSKDQVHARRLLLDHYALVAQLSVVIALGAVQLYYLASWLTRRCGKGDEERTRPSSPYLKAESENEKGSLTHSARLYSAKIRWWMGDEVADGWGRNGEWICGSLWMAWLLFLCVNGTGNDYMHLTKRFGIVAASQLPLHYLLAMKSAYSPLQMLTRMSHEKLIASHQVLGKVIQCLLTLHAAFYLNFFIRINVLPKRIKDQDVILGLVCITIITITSTAALAAIKKWNYRVFYTIHVVSATLFLPLAYFHVSHIRPFILESAGIYILHVILRTLNRRTQAGSIGLLSGTDLVQVKIPLNGQTRQFKPGQHIYFSLPQGYRGSSIPNIFLHNPFTVASLPKKDGQLVLVARALDGNTKRLAHLARQADLQEASSPRSLPVKIEGPYGSSSHLPDFHLFDRILLVAGGVGATFIIPLCRTILDMKQSAEQPLNADVRLVWAVRRLSETSWALPLPELSSNKATSDTKFEAEIYTTAGSAGSSTAGVTEAIELTEHDALVGGDDEKSITEQGIMVKHGRPDLHDVIDDAFGGQVGRVAVFVCGPTSMWKQLRHEVRRQVRRGKDVYWHAEEFGL